MADRISLTLLLTYLLALPFYLFFNVRVTGDYIPEMQTLGYHLTPEIQTWFTRIDPFTNGMPSLHIGIPFAIWYCYARNDLDGRWKIWWSLPATSARAYEACREHRKRFSERLLSNSRSSS